jgi:citrate lyase subunit beta/citryl-CoA lyase
MPGSNPRALEKAKSLAADVVLIDLEDAVAPEAKAEARTIAVAAIKAGGFGRREIVLRINAQATEWGEKDLAAAIEAKPDAILVPKIQGPEDVAAVDARRGRDGPALWVMMETPLAILNARDIAALARKTRLAGFVMGTNDLAKELRCAEVPGRAPLLASLGLAVLAARAYGLAIIDGVYNDIQDTDGFAAVCRQAVDLGFDGKTLIHPTQIEPTNRIFSPKPEDVLWARKVIAAFAEPANRGKGALKVEGRMVELLHEAEAQRLVAIADAIAAADQAASVPA